MLPENKIKAFYVVSGTFLLLNAIAIYYEFFWLSLLPAVFVIGYLGLYAMDKLILFVAFCTPLAINLSDMDVQLGLSLPTEPIMAAIMLAFFVKVLHQGNYDSAVLKHPVTIAIIVNLIWIAFTTVTSSMPLISLKFLVSRLWFVVPFFFLAILLFKKVSNIKTFIWVYLIPLTIVIFYTIFEHAKFSFGEDPAHWVMSPFYNDHTAYGAILAMFYPAIIGFVFMKSAKLNIRFIAFLLFVIFTVALVLSYTRAAWISLAVALVYWLLLLAKVQYRTMLMALGAVAAIVIFSWTDIQMKLEKNRQDTSSDLKEHLQSISNISTDASNLERMNRWSSAMRMFQERPIVGWGPGTYSFQYAPFQLSYEKTIISTNSGDGGNAHSEYIGPLAESGVLGAATMLAIVFIVMWQATNLYYRLPAGELRNLVLVLMLGLLTYFVHGSLNNFLDTDKASVPFWGFIAALLAIELYHEKQKKLVEPAAE